MAGFTLRVSVKVQGEAPISGLEAEPTISVDGITFTVKQHWPQLILSAHNFESEVAAEAFLERIKLALFNLALKLNIAFRHNFIRNSVSYFDDPEEAGKGFAKAFGVAATPVDGRADADGYTIYESGKKIWFMSFQPGALTTSTGWPLAEGTLLDGLQATPRAADAKTIIARDLHLASFYETSQRARFLTLIMCLEVMAPRPSRHRKLIDALKDFRFKLKAMRQSATPEEKMEIEGVLSQIGFSEEQSIRLRIQALIRSEAPLDAEARKALAEKIHAAYTVRSNIAHNGDDPNLPNVFDDVQTAVKLVLAARLGLPTQAQPAFR